MRDFVYILRTNLVNPFQNDKKVTIIGAGYVGFSMAMLLRRKINVEIVDKDKNKISLIKNNKSPIKDALIIDALKKERL